MAAQLPAALCYINSAAGMQVTKSLKTLIMNASLGAGSELEIEVAKGVDWTAILAIILALKQARH